MAKKLKNSSIFKNKNETTWQWPSCTHSKTLSFRADDGDDDDDNIFKTINSIFFDPFDHIETPQSSSIESSSSLSSHDDDDEEIIIKGARSERLFFELGGATSSIFQEPKLCKEEEEEEEEENELPFKESVILAMESKDPYLDFKKSMKEMVETQGIIKDWDNLQELLAWYLRLNGEVNHGFILGAFVDLLMELVFPTTSVAAATAGSSSSSNSSSSISDNSTSSSSSASAASSSFSCPSSPLSSEIEEQENKKIP